LGEEDGWGESIRAESLYRTEKYDELLALPSNPWQAAARAARDGDVAELPSQDRRAAREAGLRLRESAYSACEDRDWQRAGSLLSIAGADADSMTEVIAHLMGGNREAALKCLNAKASRDPGDHAVVHVLALALLHTLAAGDGGEGADNSWLDCIGAWMNVLHDDEFWKRWRTEAERRYGRQVTPAMMESLRADARQLLEKHITGEGSVTAAMLRREHEAAKTLADFGGFVPPDGKPLVCGPLRMSALGLHDAFGRFIAGVVDTPAAEDLMIRFSMAGLAESKLVSGNPREALSLAMDVRCPACRSRKPNAKSETPLACRPGCENFDKCNPALSHLDDKSVELVDLAAVIAVAALSRIAEDEIAKSDADLDEVRRYWKQMSSLADHCGERDAVGEAVATTALGRAQVLNRKKKFDDAITVLDAAMPVLKPGNSRERVVTELANLLISRGVATSNDQPSKASMAQADLERAAELVPRSVRAHRNLGVVKSNRATKLIERVAKNRQNPDPMQL
ncbi:MAG: tetratricopeptide repeat protein, partial [Stackebrandtia sp.]